MERWADESTLGEWLRDQVQESLKALWAIIREFVVGWVLDKAKPSRMRHGGQLEDAQAGRSRFYANSASSAGKYLNLLDERSWGWSVSYNTWTSKFDTLARAMGEDQWSEGREAVGRNGQPIIEQHGWLRHLPGEDCLRAQTFAVVRHKARDAGGMFWNYAYVVGGWKAPERKDTRTGRRPPDV